MRIPLDDLKRAVAELGALRGLRVDNVYQCDPRTFLLKLKPGPVTLLIDLHPGRARVLVTDEPPPVPQSPPVFGAILRKALRGGRFLGATMPTDDRVVMLDIDAGEPRRVVVEAFARHANLLLLDEDGTVKRVVDGDAARHRKTPVGAKYTLPAAPKIPAEESLLPPGLPDEPFAANLAIDRLFREEAAGADDEKAGRQRERLLARVKKALAAVDRDLRELADPAALRRHGELLLANYGSLSQGMKSYKGVPLDPKRSPQENVDAVFRRARKAERARPALDDRKADLEALLARIEAGETVPESRIPGRSGKPQAPRKPYRVFHSADGRRILVGKGGRDNDETTLKVAGPHDLFLHVRGSPGAHVILPLGRGEDPPEQALLDAATLALHYSKMRTANAADVCYTPRKHVSKPKGAKAGLVQVRREKVLRLRREPERLARLLMDAE
jgi:predicted ribosome quality control (RQC) complex YloA/Tae2 family protein